MARITNGAMMSQFLSDLQRTQAKLSDTQRQISTNRRVNNPSDDPWAAARELTFNGQLGDIKAYKRNVSDAINYLNTADSALSGVGSTLQRIRELVVKAANSTNDQSALNSIAKEVSQLKEALRDQANTRYGTSYLFSGTATDVQPYPPPANAYAGNNGVIQRRVSPGLQMAINLPGPAVFGTTTGAAPGQMGMFDLIDRAVADLTSGVPADREELRTLVLDAIDAQHDNVLQQRAKIGSDAARLQVTDDRLADLELRLTEARSQLIDADTAKVYLDFQSQNTMYQSALAAGARMMQTSLLDFI